MNTLLALLLVFGEMSLLAIGGVNTTLPEMQRQVVDVHGWMSAHEFASLFALAQAAPGPNFMVCVLVGWHVAGLPGAFTGLLGMLVPSSAITFGVSGLWHRFRDRPWRGRVQAGLVPVTVGLVAASAALLTASTTVSAVAAGTTLVSAVLLVRTRVHPLWVLAGGTVAGLLVG